MQTTTLTADSRALLELLICALVSDKTAVVVSVVHHDTQTMFEVSVGEKDRGKVIGASGRIARSVRMLLTAIGDQHGAKYTLSING